MAWQVVTAPSWAFDFHRRRPAAAGLQALAAADFDWEGRAEGVQKSAGGSEGVFFVGLRDPDAEAVVVKGSMSLAGELFATLLAKRLGVRVPDCRLISPLLLPQNRQVGDSVVPAEPVAAGELSPMAVKLLELDATQPLYRFVNSSGLLRRRLVMLQEFVPGTPLNGLLQPACAGDDQVGSAAVAAATPTSVFGPAEGCLSPEGRATLHQIGGMLGLDLLCHNSDRLPFLADNRGNPGNLMFTSPGNGAGCLTPIDNVATPIRPDSPLFQRYLQQVQALLVGGPPAILKRCKRVRDLIYEHCGFDIDAPKSAAAAASAEDPPADQFSGSDDDTPVVSEVPYLSGSQEIRAGFQAMLETLDGLELAEVVGISGLLRSGGEAVTGAANLDPLFFGSVLRLCQLRGKLPADFPAGGPNAGLAHLVETVRQELAGLAPKPESELDGLAGLAGFIERVNEALAGPLVHK